MQYVSTSYAHVFYGSFGENLARQALEYIAYRFFHITSHDTCV